MIISSIRRSFVSSTLQSRPRLSSKCLLPLVRIRTGFALAALLAAGVALTGSAVQAQQVSYTPQWAQQSPATSPSLRAVSSMVYDAPIGKIVLFGGNDGNSALGDTWTYSGTNWTQQSPATSPPARYAAMMAYNASSGLVVLFGGQDINGVSLADTWTYNGTTWTHVLATGPSARYSGTLSYDAATGQVVLFGGLGASTLNDTWTFNGSAWTQQSPATSPSVRYGASMAFDTATGLVVLFGGNNNGTTLNDTWTYDGSNWTLQAPPTSPSTRYLSTMTYDAVTGQVVLFGGLGTSVALAETWIFDGTTWTQTTPATSPAARYATTMAYNSATGQVTLFGGTGNGALFNDTWVYQPGSALNFGTANICTGGAPAPCSITQTLTFTFASGGTIKAPAVLTQGSASLDFTDGGSGTCTTNGTAHTYNAGDTCTVVGTFTPKMPGRRLGAAELLSSSGAVLATALVTGTGNGAEAIFPGNTTTINVGSGFSGPSSVTIDSAGNLYVADFNNNMVKEVVAVGGNIPANPTIKTLGSGFSGPSALMVDGAGNVFVADYNNNAVKEIVAVGGTIPANPTILTLGAGFSSPAGIAVDWAGNVFVADSGSSSIKEMLAVNGSIPASPAINVLGSGFASPLDVTVDSAGNVYVADSGNSAVKEILAVNGSIAANPTINTLGSGFSAPSGISRDAAGNVYVSDNGTVKEILAVGGSIPVTPTIQLLGSGFTAPGGLVLDRTGNLYVADFNNTALFEVPLATPPSLAYASAPVGSTSTDSPKGVVVENIGSSSLIFTNFATTTSDFITNNSGTCSTSTALATSGLCTANASFKPQATGARSGGLTLTDNSLSGSGATQTVPLSGTAVPSGTKAITFPQPNTPAPQNTTTTLTATASNGDPVTYTVTSGTATISGSSITYTTAGSVTIAANSAAAGGFPAAPTVSRTVQVNGPPGISFTLANHHATDPSFVVAASSPSTGTLTYSLISGPATIASDGTLTFTGAAGQVNLKVTQGADANYPPGSQTTSFQVYLGSVYLGDASGVLARFDLNGTAVSSTSGYSGGGATSITKPNAVALDSNGNAAVMSTAGLNGYDAQGNTLGGAPYTAGGITGPGSVSVDGLNAVWIANSNGTVSDINNAGTALSPSGGYKGTSSGATGGIAIDKSGNVWISNTSSNTLTEFLGAAAPLAPLSTGSKNNTTGTRP